MQACSSSSKPATTTVMMTGQGGDNAFWRLKAMNSLCLCCRRRRGLSTLVTTSLLRCAPPVSRLCVHPPNNNSRRRSGRLQYDIAAEFISKTQADMAANKYCSRPYTVFVEGNVGSGKTTFLEQFADCPNVFLAKEPVHKWQDVRGHNFLVSTSWRSRPPA